MPNSNLKLFRRHEKQCSRAYPKEYRIYEWMTETQKGKTSVKDCSCSIYSEGTLVNRHGSKTYIRPRSTGQRTWTAAEAVKQNWLAWGSTTRPPDRPEAPAEPGALSTVQEARFPSVKTLEEFDFRCAAHIPAALLRKLSEGG